MLQRDEIERAVDLQARSYRLMKWLEKALNEGFLQPEAVHIYGNMEAATRGWVGEHYASLPAAAWPTRDDVPAFSLLFSTFLTSTFDLDVNPGERRYSPDAHCFCPMCSWMVKVPHLTPKKVGAADRKTARSMQRGVLRQLSLHTGKPTPEETLEALLANSAWREAIALTTYAHDLLQRLRGVAVGPATLALWRGFAWTPQGSPKKGFVLSADAILHAQQAFLDELKRLA